MSLVIFKRCNNIHEALITVSALEAGGFHPNYHNYHHAHIGYMQMLAFGGLIIQIPANEYKGAERLIVSLQSTPITDFDPIRKRKYGMWKRSTFVFPTMFYCTLPVFFLPPYILILATILLWLLADRTPYGLTMLFFPLMLCHAKYIALPKLKEAQNES